MSTTVAQQPDIAPVSSRPGTPTWEIAHLFPLQGRWTEQDYLALETNRLIELKEGCLEFLPMPTLDHHRIVDLLVQALRRHLQQAGLPGQVVYAPVRVRLRPDLYREPDVFYLKPERLAGEPKYPHGADLVIEVVSGGSEDRKRDFEQKREDYAAAGVPEYWIVDPQQKQIHVLTLEDGRYREHGVFGPGETAGSVLLPGFSVAIDDCFAGNDDLNQTRTGGQAHN